MPRSRPLPHVPQLDQVPFQQPHHIKELDATSLLGVETIGSGIRTQHLPIHVHLASTVVLHPEGTRLTDLR